MTFRLTEIRVEEEIVHALGNLHSLASVRNRAMTDEEFCGTTTLFAVYASVPLVFLTRFDNEVVAATAKVVHELDTVVEPYLFVT